jgi:endoglucanase
MLLDPPDVTGLPPGTISGTPLRRPRGRGLTAIAALAVLALTAFAGVALAVPSAHRPAPAPIVTLLAPFPSLMANGPSSTQSAMPSSSTMPASTATVTPSPAVSTTPGMASPSPTVTQPTVTVTYVVVSQWNDGFEGEITVVNAGSWAISGWLIVVALPSDQFTWVSADASGYASHHILVLQPAAGTDSVPANGTLSVFFTVYGTSATPQLCAFNNIICG